MTTENSSSELRYVICELIEVLSSPEFAADVKAQAEAGLPTVYRKPSELHAALEETGHNISHRSIRLWCVQGKIEAVQTAGGQWRIPQPEFDRVMRERGGKPSRVHPQRKRKSPTSEYNYLKMIQRRYGLTPENYQALLDKQNSKCAICRCDPKAKYAGMGLNQQRLHIDHWHDDTHAVRGLLCANCNFGVGRWLDNPQLLRAAVRYLDKHIPLRLDVKAS